jgi:nucleoside-diphosphate-sugar epimerase
MASVLVSHADQPIGRRIVKTLIHDDAVKVVLGVGSGPAPRAFDRFLAESTPRLVYARADLARHRSVSDLFRSKRFRQAEIDTVVHVPEHGPASRSDVPVVSGLPARTAEARLVLQQSLEARTVRHLVAIGSAYVYRLDPGNANRLHETSALDLDPRVSAEIRSWIDCDMMFNGEVGSNRLRVVLLRVPTVVASGGYVYLNPSLAGRAGIRIRPAGFDPLCPLLSDKDLAQAVRLAVAGRRSGIYNISGSEAVPLSLLGRWTGRPNLPVPGGLLKGASRALGMLGLGGLGPTAEGAHLRYGFTLDTRRASRDLGYAPSYRIGLERAGDGLLRLETSAT